MESYLPGDYYYNEANNLAAYMGEQDVDMIHSMLECNQALRNGRPRPKPQLRRERNPSCPGLQTKGSVWTDILPEMRTVWAWEQDKNKEQFIFQIKEQLTKNCQLTT